MEGTVGAPPQRVCPKCARISWATGPRCPYCRARFRRQATATIAGLLLVAVILTLAGVAAMLLIARHEFRTELDDRTAQIERHFDTQVGQIRQDVRNQINALPTATPFPTPTRGRCTRTAARRSRPAGPRAACWRTTPSSACAS